MAACKNFDRIFPTTHTHKYLQFFPEVVWCKITSPVPGDLLRQAAPCLRTRGPGQGTLGSHRKGHFQELDSPLDESQICNFCTVHFAGGWEKERKPVIRVTVDQQERRRKRLSVAYTSEVTRRLDKVVFGVHSRSSPCPDGGRGHPQPTSQVEGGTACQEGQGGPGRGTHGAELQDTDLPGDQFLKKNHSAFLQLPTKFVDQSSQSSGLQKTLAYYDKSASSSPWSLSPPG